MSQEPEFIICFDREATGISLQANFMPALGASLVHIRSQKTVASYSTSLPQLPYTEWDPVCLRDFWLTPENQLWYQEVLKNVNLYKQPYLLPNGTLAPEYETYVFGLVDSIMRGFIAWTQTVCRGKRVLPGVDSDDDVAWINHYLPAGFSLATILGTYQPILNVTSFYKGLLADPFCKKDLVRRVTKERFGLDSLPDFLGARHDHHPTRDAEMTALTAAFFFNKLREEKEAKAMD